LIVGWSISTLIQTLIQDTFQNFKTKNSIYYCFKTIGKILERKEKKTSEKL